MIKLNRTIILCLLSIAILISMTSCGKEKDTSVVQIREKGELRVAVPNFDTSLFYYDTSVNGYRGVEAELMDIIASGLGVSLTYVPMQKSEFTNALNMGTVDLAIGCININSDTISSYGKTISYGGEDLFIISPRGMYVGNLSVLSEKNIGVSTLVDSTSYSSLYYSGVSNIYVYGNTQSALEDLRNNNIFAYVCYKDEAIYMSESGEFQVQNSNDLTREEFTIITMPQYSELISGCNVLIQNYIDGESSASFIESASENIINNLPETLDEENLDLVPIM